MCVHKIPLKNLKTTLYYRRGLKILNLHTIAPTVYFIFFSFLFQRSRRRLNSTARGTSPPALTARQEHNMYRASTIGILVFSLRQNIRAGQRHVLLSSMYINLILDSLKKATPGINILTSIRVTCR